MFDSEKEIIYSVPIDSKSSNGQQGRIYRNPMSQDKLPERFSLHPEIQTLKDVVLRAFDNYKKNDFIGFRRRIDHQSFGSYQFRSYGEIELMCQQIGSAIITMDLAPQVEIENEGAFKFIAVYAKNRQEYLILDLCCALYGFTLVPIYHTLDTEMAAFIMRQTGVRTLFCSSDYVDKIIEQKQKSALKDLKTIISFEECSYSQIKLAQNLQLNLLNWSFLINEVEPTEILGYPPISPDSSWVVLYTSGTTGTPKGAKLHHGGFLCELITWLEKPNMQFYPSDVYYSFLPMAHIFERILQWIMIFSGASIAFYHGDPKEILDDIKILRPTVFASPPSVYNKFYGIFQQCLSQIADLNKEIIDKAIQEKLDNLHQSAEFTHTFYDAMIFNRCKLMLGGKMRCMITGAAPISPTVLDFVKIASCCPIIEVYGTTESHGACLITRIEDGYSGHVGGPTLCVEMKLADIPEMKDKNKDKQDNEGKNLPRGELCIRGPQVFKGYLKNLEATKETIDNEGWLHTGDIVQINPNGSFKIIDRIKHVFKLPNGEYVAPERIESVYRRSKYIEECFVYGESTKNYLVGIISPNEQNLMELAGKIGIQGNLDILCKSPEICQKITEELENIGKLEGLSHYEMIKKIMLIPKSFSELNLATPSFKLKRSEIKKFFNEELNSLYSNNNQQVV